MRFFSQPQLLRRAIVAGMTLAVIVAGSSAAQARSLDEAADALAGQIKKYLESKKQTDVFVGPINGPSNTGAGPAIVKALKDKLKKSGSLNVTTSKGWRVGGRFTRHEKNGEIIIGLIVSLFDDDGNPKLDFRGPVKLDERIGETVTRPGEGSDFADNPEDTTRALGTTVDIVTPEPKETNGKVTANTDAGEPQAATPAERIEKITEKDNKPSVHVGEKGFVASPFNGSPYRMEILVRKKGTGVPGAGPAVYEPRFIRVEDGLAYTDLFDGDIYAVRIYNYSQYDAGVKLSIDGINCLEFSEFRDLGMWVVPRAKDVDHPGVVTIKGWLVSHQHAESFEVTARDKGVAAELGRDLAAIGTITAQFFAAWAAGEPKPPIEGEGSRNALATGRGPNVGVDVGVVHRFFGRSLLAAVSVRYDKPGDDEIAEDLPADPGPQDTVSADSLAEEPGT